METGRVFIIPGLSFNNPDAPKLVFVDPIESSGSLVLIEPMNTAAPWAAGVPANGTTVGNLMSEFAGKLGIATPAVAATIYNVGMTGPQGLLERTSKGGLQGITSKTTSPAAGNGFSMELSPPLKAYLIANPTHKYFVSLWRKVTRPGSIEQFSGVHNASGGTNNHLYILGADLSRPLDAGTTFGGARVINRNAVGASLLNIAANGWLGGVPALGTTMARACSWGAVPGVIGATSNLVSSVFYRFYIEDLTVSGRSYAEVDAIDYAQFDKHVLTAGGRYFGDTHTDPAVLP